MPLFDYHYNLQPSNTQIKTKMSINNRYLSQTSEQSNETDEVYFGLNEKRYTTIKNLNHSVDNLYGTNSVKNSMKNLHPIDSYQRTDMGISIRPNLKNERRLTSSVNELKS